MSLLIKSWFFDLAAPNEFVLVRYTDAQVRRFIGAVVDEGRAFREMAIAEKLAEVRSAVGPDARGPDATLTAAELLAIPDPWNGVKESPMIEGTGTSLHTYDSVPSMLGRLGSPTGKMPLNLVNIKGLDFGTNVSARSGASSLREEVEFAYYLKKLAGDLDLRTVESSGNCLFDALMQFIRLPPSSSRHYLPYTSLDLRRQLVVALLYHR